MIYLAVPYSKYPYGKMASYISVSRLAAKLMKEGHIVFSPISASHAIENIALSSGDWEKPEDGPFWLKQDFAVLKHCEELVVYKLDGWDKSEGVAAEMQFAAALGIPIRFIEPEPYVVYEAHSG